MGIKEKKSMKPNPVFVGGIKLINLYLEKMTKIKNERGHFYRFHGL